MRQDGLLLVDKPIGMTSHDVVSRLRKVFQTRKIGHAGTLDPDASGLLLVCVGDATRLIEYMVADDKAYEGEIHFGVQTDTDDATGQVIAKESAAALTNANLREVERLFRGELEQQVPKYSAVHIDGERAHALARAGIDFVPPVRLVCIHQLSFEPLIHSSDGAEATARFFVACSKGTYIRSLCRDVGVTLRVPAHLSGLRRVKSGYASIDAAVSLDELGQSSQPHMYLRNPRVGLLHLSSLNLDEGDVTRLALGQKIVVAKRLSSPLLLVLLDGEIAAIVMAESHDNGTLLKPRKVFWKRR